ncbi:MAG TPA: hypothetical protein VMD28_07820 [Acidimicrobiales bacterium]|nr:hypothetical protein [Acidimicrobiales bacterium]
MTFTKVAVVGGLALLGFVCWLAASGLGVAREGLISLCALVLLVGGGNLLSGRPGSSGRRGAAAVRRGQPTSQPGDATGADDERPSS